MAELAASLQVLTELNAFVIAAGNRRSVGIPFKHHHIRRLSDPDMSVRADVHRAGYGRVRAAAFGTRAAARCDDERHSREAGKNMVGPSLHGLIGRKAGSVPGYAYSPAMKNANVTWNDDTLSKYLSDPTAFIPGDKMVFTGIKNPSSLGDLLAYLNQATR
jgi:cytochrome c